MKVGNQVIDEQKVTLDFSSILENYETSLVDQLRNFGLDGEIFETWVPDPDPIKSLVNLVDSTVESGAELVLDIRIKKETLSHIDIDRFRREINRYLAVEVTTIPDGLAIVVSGFGKWSHLVTMRSIKRVTPIPLLEFLLIREKRYRANKT